MGLDPRWLAAALPSSLAFVGPEREIEIAVDGGLTDLAAAIRSLHPRLDISALAAATAATRVETEDLIATLLESGALVEDPEPDAGGRAVPLATALLAVRDGRALTAADRAAVVTADELLVLPRGVGAEVERRALRAFVGGMAPDLRLRAYCQIAAAGADAVRGDRPSAEALARAMRAVSSDDDRELVVDLAGGSIAGVAPDEVGKLGCERPHRLGPVLSTAPLERAEEAAGHDMHVFASRYAVANLRYPTPSADRVAGGRAPDRDLAELIARAEAAERYASGDVGRHEVVRARQQELDGPFVAPADMFRPNDRQRRHVTGDPVPYDPGEAHLWIAGTTARGGSRWVLAEAVFYPLDDPRRKGRTLLTSSSGSAAHATVEEARLRALCELVERDAFMWTWIQRVARERIAGSTLPPVLAGRVALLERSGFDVAFVNLTIDLLPVLACVIHSRDRLALAAACSLDPADAARRSLDEAVGLIEMFSRGRLDAVAPEEVRTPRQHAALYLDPERVDRARFLAGSSDEIALAEVELPGIDPDELVSAVADPIAVDLTSPATAPFHVVRVVVPGLVPVSFGYDREPLGMPRLAAPKRAHDGRMLGARLDLAEAGPLDPHPFA